MSSFVTGLRRHMAQPPGHWHSLTAAPFSPALWRSGPERYVCEDPVVCRSVHWILGPIKLRPVIDCWLFTDGLVQEENWDAAQQRLVALAKANSEAQVSVPTPWSPCSDNIIPVDSFLALILMSPTEYTFNTLNLIIYTKPFGFYRLSL